MAQPKTPKDSPPVAEKGATKKLPKMEFPKHTLAEALRVAKSLEDKNGGLPLPPTETAIAIGMSPGSSTFRDLLSSSIKYGLTTGSFNGDRVALTGLAEQIVRPRSNEEVNAAMVEAAFKPPMFTSMFEHFRGKKLPEAQFFKNAVSRDLGVPAEFAETCVSVFVRNVEQLGLVQNATTGKWLSSVAQTTGLVQPTVQDEGLEISEEIDPELETGQNAQVGPQQNGRLAERRTEPKNHIFIGHGRSKEPLNQLKAILTQLGIPFKVAEEEASVGRPISSKVADILNECGAAILIFSADEELRDTTGATIWRPRENVVHELGAASVLYGNRIIIFKEAAVNLASNFKDIGYISFEKDQLSAKMPDLLKELVAFGLVKLTVGG